MATNYIIKTFEVDYLNMTISYIPGTGTLINVAKSEEGELLGTICKLIEDEGIKVPDVLEQHVAKAIMWYFVEREAYQLSSRNGQRPQKINVIMNPTVAKIAANVTSVKRPQITYYTLGGVEPPKEHQRGVQELLQRLGKSTYIHFRKILDVVHTYAMSENKPATANTAQMDLVIAIRCMRDALVRKEGLPLANLKKVTTMKEEEERLANVVRSNKKIIRRLQARIKEAQANLEAFQSFAVIAKKRKITSNQNAPPVDHAVDPATNGALAAAAAASATVVDPTTTTSVGTGTTDLEPTTYASPPPVAAPAATATANVTPTKDT